MIFTSRLPIRSWLDLDSIRTAAATTMRTDVPALRAALLHHGWRGAALHRTCGAVHRAARETLGVAPFDTQWLAALSLLDGRLAEMATGEGKTMALGLAATVAALAGRRVHVITANDYLVARDAAAMRPLFAHFGLEVGTVLAGSTAQARRQAYRQNVVYVTARELVFDSLRDSQAGGQGGTAVMRHATSLAGGPPTRALQDGLDVALIDEADSILLDEAEMPLILSRPVRMAREARALADALGFARLLRRHVDFLISPSSPWPRLTGPGERQLQRLADDQPGAWFNRVHRDESVERALAALHTLQRDRDYLVRDGEVVLIDAVTGRAAPNRAWGHGLHELVAMKEGCAAPVRSEAVAQLTYPRFFPRYRHLAGMSGTLREAAGELKRLYGLRVSVIPLRQPSRRQQWPSRIFASADARWQAVAERAAELSAQGRPVLIGTQSVADSMALADLLTRAGCEFALLNAAQDADEARIVACAGLAGRITVATNMAGRGTDIALADGVAQAGGLHVLSCQDNPSRRLDRQLSGRCARQGDPGSAEHWRVWPRDASAADASEAAHWLARRMSMLHAHLQSRGVHVPGWATEAAFRWRQGACERQSARERRRLIEIDRIQFEQLGFALPAE